MFLSSLLGGDKRDIFSATLDEVDQQQTGKVIDRMQWVQERMRRRQAEFSQFGNVSLFTASWNVAGNIVKDETSLQEWLLPTTQRYDLICVSLQEIVALNAMNVVVTALPAMERANLWKEKILSMFRANNLQYTTIFERSLVGTSLLIFAKNEILSRIHSIRGAVYATGAGGFLGNKGAVVARLRIDQTSICVVSSHLSADRDNVRARNGDFKMINDRCSLPIISSAEDTNGVLHFGNKGTVVPHQQYTLDSDAPVGIDDHDVVFWLGDLNYRLDVSVPDEIVYSLVTNADWTLLKEQDQLLLEMASGRAFQGYQEGLMLFPPTYKYEVNSTEFSMKKGRLPAWCDRILWKVKSDAPNTTVSGKTLSVATTTDDNKDSTAEENIVRDMVVNTSYSRAESSLSGTQPDFTLTPNTYPILTPLLT